MNVWWIFYYYSSFYLRGAISMLAIAGSSLNCHLYRCLSLILPPIYRNSWTSIHHFIALDPASTPHLMRLIRLSWQREPPASFYPNLYVMCLLHFCHFLDPYLLSWLLRNIWDHFVSFARLMRILSSLLLVSSARLLIAAN